MSENDSSQPIVEKQITSQEKLKMLRVPFPPHQVSKLPKETKEQKAERTSNRNLGIRCQLCNGWHHKDVVHLDYVGHAALTDRLLEVDLYWYWEPMAYTPEGLPLFDKSGGLWIKLFVAGMKRLGYGHAASSEYKDPGAREKEVIGDALRNAGMRFGMALDLWHKGDLHSPDEQPEEKKENKPFTDRQSGPKPQNKAPQGPVPGSYVFPVGFPEVAGKKVSSIGSSKLEEIKTWCQVESIKAADNEPKKAAALNKVINEIDLFLKSGVRQ